MLTRLGECRHMQLHHRRYRLRSPGRQNREVVCTTSRGTVGVWSTESHMLPLYLWRQCHIGLLPLWTVPDAMLLRSLAGRGLVPHIENRVHLTGQGQLATPMTSLMMWCMILSACGHISTSIQRVVHLCTPFTVNRATTSVNPGLQSLHEAQVVFGITTIRAPTRLTHVEIHPRLHLLPNHGASPDSIEITAKCSTFLVRHVFRLSLASLVLQRQTSTSI